MHWSQMSGRCLTCVLPDTAQARDFYSLADIYLVGIFDPAAISSLDISIMPSATVIVLGISPQCRAVADPHLGGCAP